MIDTDALRHAMVRFLKSRAFDGPDPATDSPEALADGLVWLVKEYEHRGLA